MDGMISELKLGIALEISAFPTTGGVSEQDFWASKVWFC